jgi:death-on-curing protein
VPRFLTLDEVLESHVQQLATYGGSEGIRDISLLQSALAQPEATFGGQWLHADLFEMAAAYLFHIVQNHPFIDGNKRVGLESALLFLEINGQSVEAKDDELVGIVLHTAQGKMTKVELAIFLRTHSVSSRARE